MFNKTFKKDESLESALLLDWRAIAHDIKT